MRITSNLHGGDLAALSSLNNVYNQMNKIALQLATGLRINRSSDDPAGTIAAESLDIQSAATTQAAHNASFAQYSLDIADSGMGQAANLLDSIRANLATAADASTTNAQRAALQQQVNAALKQIDQIGTNTSFAGRKLLNGSVLQFQLSPAGKADSLQMPNISTTALGGTVGKLSDLASGGSANLQNGDLQNAQAIIDQAQQQIMNSRANVASFEKYTVETASANLNSMRLNITSALSNVRDTDMAEAVTGLIRTQFLASALVGVVRTNLKTQSLVLDALK
jgi:flagellin-like hook-associated protein FlgL